ncbi:MAG: sodium:proton antiporter [Pleurocapsa sp. MO_192.B19]|nr:sodium:proton antiporter [Pleurocapsa sp. MO_192.B19]
MTHNTLLMTQIGILALLLVACFATIALKRLKFPYTVGLVIVGLIVGWLAQNVETLQPLQHLTLSPNLILFVFVPPLIFESAQNIDCRLLSRNLFPVAVLAAPGLWLSTAVIGILLGWLTPLTFLQAFLFGAMISATDPVAVIALFKECGVPKRLNILVEGESLFNDATAIVTFNIILTVIAAGTLETNTLSQGLVKAVVVLLGGIVVGIVLAAVMGYFVTFANNNPFIQSTVSAVVAYAAFIIADLLSVSGVIAVLTAGIIVGWLNANRVPVEVRQFMHEFWEYAAFIANSLIFLLVGLSTAQFIAQSSLGISSFGAIFWAIAISLLARAVAVYTLVPLINWIQKSDPIDLRYQTVSFWGGLRGAVALALALSLAVDFPNRELMTMMTLAVALFTIISGGTTMASLLHGLNLDRPTVLDRLAKAEALVAAKQEGLQQLVDLKTMPMFDLEAIASLQQEYQQQVKETEMSLANLWSELSPHPQQLQQAVWLQAISLEKQGYQELYDQKLISEITFDQLKLSLNLKQDDILAERILPNHQLANPLTTSWEKMTDKFLRLVTPHPEFQVHQQEHELKLRYEYNAAVVYVCDRVAQEVSYLAKEISPNTEPAFFAECIESYRGLAGMACKQLAAEMDIAPQIAISVQQKIARRVAAVSEAETLTKLAAEGVVSNSVASKVRDRLEAETPLQFSS